MAKQFDPVWLLSLSILAISIACSPAKKAGTAAPIETGIWQANAITIDGSDVDWPNPLPYIDAREKLSYCVSNDKENVYVCFKTGNEQTQVKMLQAGFTVNINADGKKKKATAIGMPIGSKSPEMPQGIKPGERIDFNKMKFGAIARLKEYILVGFAQHPSAVTYAYGDTNEQGVEVKLDFNNSNELVYEALIPLRSIFSKDQFGSVNEGKPIAIGFFINALQKPNIQGMGGGLPSGGQAGGMGGGDFPDGALGGSQQDMEALFKEIKIWTVTALATGNR